MQTKEISLQSKKSAVPSALVWLSVIVFFLIFSPKAAELVKSGISLCIGTVIPSVFPFMVISALVVSLGAGRDLGALFSFPLRLIFGISSAAACPVFIGLVCGYPTGAFTAAAMLDKGEITKKELSRLLTFINVPSAAFVICGAGAGMLGSAKLGICIYVSVILSAVTVGVAGRFSQKEGDRYIPFTRTGQGFPLSQAIPDAIRSAAVNMMCISACVITFSSLSGLICSLPLISSAPDWAKTVITGIFEVSSGARSASLTQAPLSPLLVSSVCAWSGLSVHTQIISACRGRGISFTPFFVSKAAQAILAPAYLSAILHFFG